MTFRRKQSRDSQFGALSRSTEERVALLFKRFVTRKCAVVISQNYTLCVLTPDPTDEVRGICKLARTPRLRVRRAFALVYASLSGRAWEDADGGVAGGAGGGVDGGGGADFGEDIHIVSFLFHGRVGGKAFGLDHTAQSLAQL